MAISIHISLLLRFLKQKSRHMSTLLTVGLIEPDIINQFIELIPTVVTLAEELNTIFIEAINVYSNFLSFDFSSSLTNLFTFSIGSLFNLASFFSFVNPSFLEIPVTIPVDCKNLEVLMQNKIDIVLNRSSLNVMPYSPYHVFLKYFITYKWVFISLCVPPISVVSKIINNFNETSWTRPTPEAGTGNVNSSAVENSGTREETGSGRVGGGAVSTGNSGGSGESSGSTGNTGGSGGAGGTGGSGGDRGDGHSPPDNSDLVDLNFLFSLIREFFRSFFRIFRHRVEFIQIIYQATNRVNFRYFLEGMWFAFLNEMNHIRNTQNEINNILNNFNHADLLPMNLNYENMANRTFEDLLDFVRTWFINWHIPLMQVSSREYAYLMHFENINNYVIPRLDWVPTTFYFNFFDVVSYLSNHGISRQVDPVQYMQLFTLYFNLEICRGAERDLELGMTRFESPNWIEDINDLFDIQQVDYVYIRNFLDFIINIVFSSS